MTDPIRARRIDVLRAEVVHRLEEINRLGAFATTETEQAAIEALAKMPSIPPREEADFGSDIPW